MKKRQIADDIRHITCYFDCIPISYFFFYFSVAAARLCRQSESMPTLQLHISFKRNILGIFYKKSVSCVISRFYNFDIFE